MSFRPDYYQRRPESTGITHVLGRFLRKENEGLRNGALLGIGARGEFQRLVVHPEVKNIRLDRTVAKRLLEAEETLPRGYHIVVTGGADSKFYTDYIVLNEREEKTLAGITQAIESLDGIRMDQSYKPYREAIQRQLARQKRRFLMYTYQYGDLIGQAPVDVMEGAMRSQGFERVRGNEVNSVGNFIYHWELSANSTQQ